MCMCYVDYETPRCNQRLVRLRDQRPAEQHLSLKATNELLFLCIVEYIETEPQ